MNTFSLLVVLLAQIRTAPIYTHRASPPPLYIEPVTVSPRVTADRTITADEATRIPAARNAVVPAPVLAPVAESWYDALPAWWPLIVLLAGWLAYRVRDRRTGLAVPDRTTLVPATPTEEPAGPTPLARRSLEDCRTLYIDTVRAQVRAMIGRSDIRAVYVPSAPVEMAWRAWMQAPDYQTAKPQHRAVGRSEGAALKGLLATHRQYGGDWIGFAVDRERAMLGAAIPTAVPTAVNTPAERIVEAA